MDFVLTTVVGTEELNLLLASKIGDRFYSVKEIMSVPSLANTVYLDSRENFELPFLITEDPGAFNLTTLNKIFINGNYELSDSDKNAICKALNVGTFNFTPEIIEELNRCAKEFSSYMQGNTVKIKMSVSWYYNVKRTLALVQNINGSGKSESIYIEGDNKTILRRDPSDELFIKVPDYDELRFTGIPVTGIQRPFEDERLSGPEFEKFITEEISIDKILGNPKNNKLPIQPNEMRYKKALTALLDFGIERENKDLTIEEAKKILDERVKAMSEGKDVDKKVIGSVEVKNYLIDLAHVGIYLNWSHTGLVPVSILDDIADDDYADSDDIADDDKAVETEQQETTSSRAFKDITGRSFNIGNDYKSAITELLLDVYDRNPYDVIDIVIRLFRFGDMKPDRLEMPDGRYFDLNVLQYRSSSGSYDSTEIVYDEEGNSLEVLGRIDFSASIQDKRYSVSHGLKDIDKIGMPVGLVCMRQFNGSDEPQFIYMSFIDLIKAYENNDRYCKIKGIAYDGNKFSISKEVNEILNPESREDRELYVHALQNQIMLIKKSRANEFYCYSEFEDAFLYKTCFDSSTSILSIINKYYAMDDLSMLDVLSFEDTEELDFKINENLVPPKACIEANAARLLIPLLSNINQVYSDSILSGNSLDIEDLINIYSSEMKRSNFRYDLYVAEPNTKVEESENLSKSNSFAIQKEIKNLEGGYDALKELTTYDLDGYSYGKIIVQQSIAIKIKERFKDLVTVSVNTTNGTAMIGIVAYKPKSPFVFLDPKTNVETSNVLKFGDLCPALMDNVKSIFREESPKYRFESAEIGAYYSELAKEYLMAENKRQ